jgi:hypothetical protein
MLNFDGALLRRLSTTQVKTQKEQNEAILNLTGATQLVYIFINRSTIGDLNKKPFFYHFLTMGGGRNVEFHYYDWSFFSQCRKSLFS